MARNPQENNDNIDNSEIIRENKNGHFNLRVENILESITDAFFALDGDWRFTYLNKQSEKLLQRRREDLLGKNIWEEFPEAVGTTFDAQYHKAVAEQISVIFDEFYPPLDTWFEVRAYPLPEGLAVYYHNINERKKAEQTLRETEERYRALIEATATTVWHATPEGALSFVGESWTAVSGQTIEEILKWGWLEAVHPDDRERTIEIWQKALANKTLYKTEFRIKTIGGNYRWFEASAVPILDAAGNIREWVGINIDVDAKRQAEEQIRESEQKFTVLANAVPQLVWMADADGFIFWYNRNWYDYTGTTPAEMEGWGWQKVHDPEMIEMVTTRWKESIQTGERFEMEFPLRGDNGAFRWFLTRVNPLRDSENKIIRWFGTNTDIEEFRQARMQAEQANQLKDEFLATLSHELRTPLNAILGWSQMLQSRSNIGENEREKALMTIERSARAQNQLIDDLLDVSRIITGKLRLDVRAVDLSEVIAAAVDAARPAAEAKNIRLQSLLDPQAGPVSGDPDRMQQIVWNLLTNAVKFTPKNGRVQVRLERVNSHVEIVVSDTGKGIEAEFLPHVFDRFRQSDGSMTRRHGGLGLGLAIVRQLVELHGGSVSVESAGNEQGATFTINLPLLPLRREPASDTPREHPAARRMAEKEDYLPKLNDLRVLIVDDEADSRDILSLILVSCGAKVSTASSASEAIETLRREKFDVLVSDIGMPDEDGFSLIGKIRKLPIEEGGKVPAIALTAYARAEDRIRVLRSGFQMHIAKPVEPAELIAVVANLSERPGI